MRDIEIVQAFNNLKKMIVAQAQDLIRQKALISALIHTLEKQKADIDAGKGIVIQRPIVITEELDAQLNIELENMQKALDAAIAERDKPKIIVPDKSIIK